MAVATGRERNPRGQGTRLRSDIVAAATALLEDTGSEDAVTLRAIARQAGITAPSIYAHFPDRDAVLTAVMDEAFTELTAALDEARAGVADPVAALHAGCRAYVRFAAERPHRYRVLFGRPHPTALTKAKATMPPQSALDFADATDPGALAFRVLVDGIGACVAAGRSDSTDPFADAVALWAALHGYATLRQGQPHFPWPDDDALQDALVDRIARVRPARRRGRSS